MPALFESVRVLWVRLLPFSLLFLAAQTVIRLALMFVARDRLEGVSDYIVPLATGFWYDLAVLLMALPMIVIAPVLLPKQFAGSLFDRSVALGFFAILAMLMLFQACAEYFFWDEFTTRFNFIAVDYLIYTQEVLGNIFESYPVKTLLAIVFALGAAIAFVFRRRVFSGLQPHPALGSRLMAFFVFVALGAGAWAATGKQIVDGMTNETAKELGSNGLYNFVYAFFNNEIEFARFYPTIDREKAVALTQAHFTNSTQSPDAVVERSVSAKGPFLRKNVIQISMESMSASFMGTFGNKDGLTPNLDRFASEGLLLSNMRATGTRTVRGLEALALSVPPTPGQSILRRPGSDNLFTLGGVFQDAGYDTKFLYGGHGYFDNMNGFFASNGYGTGDQGDMAAQDIAFANAWGVSDEDLFEYALTQGDISNAKGKNFFFTVMTTSNHRPFTYPDGKIDIPSPGGRAGAVKYSDFAVGRLIEMAREKPWFKDTVFVFVADHTDSVAGREELDVNRYHIPCIIWAPGFVQPQKMDQLVSQIDVAPTILGLLSASYTSRFFGVDVLAGTERGEVYVSNYEKVATVKDGVTTVLEPVAQLRQYRDGKLILQSEVDQKLADDTIAMYQTASEWRTASKRLPSNVH